MKKALLIFGLVVIIAVVMLGGYKFFKPSEPVNMPQDYSNKKAVQQIHRPELRRRVAMIIAMRDFRDEEYFIPKEIFEKAGIEVVTVSTEVGIAIGAGGGDTEVNLALEELNVGDFDAIVFVGGPGAYKYIESDLAHQIAKEAISQNKILAAICIAPAILAKAGVLEGKKATVWSSILDKSPIKMLEENGAVYQDRPVVKDGNIITANGPQAAEEFAKTIIEAL
jgi:protease I